MKFKFTSLIFVLLLLNGLAFSQSADTLSTAPAGGGEVLELGEIQVKIEPEKPRVNIYSSRIQPEFTDIQLDKTFKDELLGKKENEEILKKHESEEIPKIEIEKFISKKR